MRDPLNLKQVDYKDNDTTVITLDDVPEFDIEDYDLLDPKEFKKYILNIKRLIRGSFEYRQMVKYLRENLNMNKCSFYANVNNIDTFKIKIHLHHEPFCLEDIVSIVYNKRCQYGESLEENMVAKEVMFLHYKLMIGLIPLAETVHELVHNSYLFIPLDRVYGKIDEFYNMYEEFMTPEQKDIYERCREYTKEYNKHVSDLRVLGKHYIYVDMTGAYDIPELNTVIDMMNDRIAEIKNKPKIEESQLEYPITRN